MKGYLFFAALSLFSLVTEGGVYQWADETGQVHFGSVPPHQQTEYSLGDELKRAADKKALLDANKSDAKKQSDKKQSANQKKAQPEKPVKASVHLDKPATDKKISAKELEKMIQKLRKHEKGSQKVTAPGDAKVKGTLPSAEHKPKSVKDKNAHTKNTATSNGVVDKKNKKTKKETKKETQKTKTVGSAKAAGVAAKKAKPTAAKTKPSNSKKPPSSGLASKKSEGLASKPSLKPSSKPSSQHKDMSEKDADKCGIFVNFVEQYKEKVREGCPGAFCDIYKRQLKKYQLKAKHYC